MMVDVRSHSEASGHPQNEDALYRPMIQTVEAVVDESGRVRLLGELHVTGPRRALVTVLEEPAAVPGETRYSPRRPLQ